MVDDIACEPVGAARKFRCHRVVQITHGERTARTDSHFAPEHQVGVDAARDLCVTTVGEVVETAAEPIEVRICARDFRRNLVFRLVERKRTRAAEGNRLPFGRRFRQGEGERRRCRGAVLLGDVSHVVGVLDRRAFDEGMHLLICDIQSSRPCQRDFHFFGMLFDVLRHIFRPHCRRRPRSTVRPAVELRGGALLRVLVLQLYLACRILHALRRRRLLPCHSCRAAPGAEEGRVLRFHIHIARRRVRRILKELDVCPVKLRFGLGVDQIKREAPRARDLHLRRLLVFFRLRRDVVRRALLGVCRRIRGCLRVLVRRILRGRRRRVRPGFRSGDFVPQDVRRTQGCCFRLFCRKISLLPRLVGGE